MQSLQTAGVELHCATSRQHYLCYIECCPLQAAITASARAAWLPTSSQTCRTSSCLLSAHDIWQCVCSACCRLPSQLLQGLPGLSPQGVLAGKAAACCVPCCRLQEGGGQGPRMGAAGTHPASAEELFRGVLGGLPLSWHSNLYH
jgi:hypothetical protein